MHDSNIFNTILGFIEYMTIKKTLTGINLENMELIHRRQEITKLQSELIEEKKMCDPKLEINLTQELKLDKKKTSTLTHDRTPCSNPSQTEYLCHTPK